MSVQLIPPGGVDRIPPYDPRSGEHYWVLPVVFRVADPVSFETQPDGPALMDRENLVLVTAVGCFYCEHEFLPSLLHRRCPGP